jgi:hypothetical protein
MLVLNYSGLHASCARANNGQRYGQALAVFFAEVLRSNECRSSFNPAPFVALCDQLLRDPLHGDLLL